MNSNNGDQLALALRLAALGWKVFPCNADKTPRLRSGFKAATNDPEVIQSWAAKWSGGLVGVACSPSGFFAVDIDNKNGVDGGQSWQDLVETRGAGVGVPVVPMQTTPSGGAHLLFSWPAGMDSKGTNKAEALGSGLDLRTDGYICTGQGYTWQPGHEPESGLTSAPAWLLEMISNLRPQKAKSPATTAQDKKNLRPGRNPGDHWLKKALDRSHEGNRNDTGYWLAGQLRDAGLSIDQATTVMVYYAARVPGEGYTEEEALTSLQSAYNLPRRDPARRIGCLTEPYPATVPPAQGLRPIDPTPGDLGLDDIGNGQRLAWRHGSKLRWVEEWGWMVYDGKTWTGDRGLLPAWCKETARSILAEAAACEDDSKRTAIIKHARASASRRAREAMAEAAASEPGIPAAPEHFDCDPWRLNCQNGAVDLRSGELLSHDPGQLMTKITAAPYTPGATCPTWHGVLDRIFAHDQALIDFVQLAIGYSLTGHVGEQCLFFLYGTGANGKSTFTGAIQDLLGGYAMKTRAETLMVKRHDQIPEEVAQLAGVRFMLAAELGEGQRLNESLIKDLTGGDRLRARLLHKNSFEFTPICKPWLYGNHRPTVRGTDEGIWRRVRLVPFSVVIPEGERDKHLSEKLRAELPGILSWAIQGCMAWQRAGLAVPLAVKRATEDYRTEQDLLGTFLSDSCVISPMAVVTAGELYKHYREWAEAAGMRPMHNVNFSRQLAERGYKTGDRDGAGRAVYSGIGLRSTVPDDEK